MLGAMLVIRKLFLPLFVVISLFEAAIATGAQTTLSIQSGVTLSWPVATGNTYRVQWSLSSGGPWSDLNVPVPGTSPTNTFYDPVAAGARHYRVLEIVPGSTPAASIPVNGGFEVGSGMVASHWTAAAARPPMRTNLHAHSGSFSMRCALTNVTGAATEGTLSQLVAAQGGTIASGQAYAFSFWARQVTSGPSYVQQYQVQWLNSVGAVIGGSGLVNFDGTPGSWTKVSVMNLVAPGTAVEARVFFRFATGAVPGGHGEVFIDDVALESGGGTAGPGQTNILSVAVEPSVQISWPTTLGAEYQPELTTAIGPSAWTTFSSNIVGDGGAQSFLLPLTNQQRFIRLQSPSIAVQPPSNFRAIAPGATNAIGLAWSPSSTPGVIGYRIWFGLASNTLTHSANVGNVTTATIGNLTPGGNIFLRRGRLHRGWREPAQFCHRGVTAAKHRAGATVR
jgi:hypothetical protein